MDCGGNVYFTEGPGGRVLKATPAQAAYRVSTAVDGFTRPIALAVDGPCNLFLLDASGTVVRVSFQNGQPSRATVASGLGQPRRLAVDRLGS